MSPSVGTPPSGDEPSASLEGEVRPGPLEHHQDSVAKADQEEDVDEDPEEPRHESRRLELADVGDAAPPPDHGELALVAIPKRAASLAAQIRLDRGGGVLTHLNRGGADAR